MKTIIFSLIFFLSTIAMVGQTGNIDFKTGGLGYDATFARMDVSVFNTDTAKFSFGGGYRLLSGDAGFMHSGAMSFAGLAQYNHDFFRLSAGPSLQLRNGKFGAGGVLAVNVKGKIANNTFVLFENKVEIGSRMAYVRGAGGVMIGKISFMGGFESTHDGFFTEIRYQPINAISIGVSFIEATGWHTENGTSRKDGIAIDLGVRF